MSAAARRPEQTVLKRLAGVLAFGCLILLVLAVDPGRAAEAARGLRDTAAPLAARVADWAGDAVSGRLEGWGDGWSDLKRAVRGAEAGPLRADPGPATLVGEYRPADDGARAATGGVTFVGATLRFERGETLSTQPMRIAAGRDAFAHDATFAARLEAAADAQIELRRVTPPRGARAPAGSGLCGGDAPAVAALLHRRRQVDLILFRQGVPPGPEAPESLVCGVWRYRR